jgi:hypothetical protein
MKKNVLVIVFLIVSSGLFAQVKDSTEAWHYSTKDYDCAIFPKANNDYAQAGKRFSPDFSDIDKAEHALLEQLLLQRDSTKRIADINRHLKKYKRQYFGYTGTNGHKILYINLFWDDNKYVKDWLKQMMMVQGGSASYWNIKYDLDTNKLFDMQINADE